MTSELIKISDLYSTHDRVQILKALDFMKKAHNSQKRQSGEKYEIHPIAVANIVIEKKVIPEIIIAALLHDVLEDTSVTFDEMYHEFGFQIAKIVNMLSKSHKIKIIEHGSDLERKLLHHQFLETIKDPRSAIIKVADRYHNISTLEYLSTEKKTRISTETIKIYVPLAYEMGLSDLSTDLEQKSKKYLSEEQYLQAKKISKNYDQEIREKGYHKNAIEKCVLH